MRSFVHDCTTSRLQPFRRFVSRPGRPEVQEGAEVLGPPCIRCPMAVSLHPPARFPCLIVFRSLRSSVCRYHHILIVPVASATQCIMGGASPSPGASRHARWSRGSANQEDGCSVGKAEIIANFVYTVKCELGCQPCKGRKGLQWLSGGAYTASDAWRGPARPTASTNASRSAGLRPW